MLYPPAIMFPPGHQRAYLELSALGQDSFLASIIYIVGSHIVQGFVIAPLVVVVDELGNRCPEAIRTKRDHQLNVVFQRPVQTLDLTDGLRVMSSGAQMPQAVSPQEVTHRPKDITTAVVRQHSRPTSHR